MNQPLSACSTFLNEVTHPTVSLPFSNRTIQDTRQSFSPEAVRSPMDFDNDLPYDDWMDDQVDDIQNGAPEPDLQVPGPGTTSPGNVEYFPGTSQSYPGGKTFMDQFFSDKHGELRRENLFYLFASQQDWQIASWLLRSRLSMAAIDSFLSMDLVSYIQLCFKLVFATYCKCQDQATPTFVSNRERATPPCRIFTFWSSLALTSNSSSTPN